jgi:hypothetical protein
VVGVVGAVEVVSDGAGGSEEEGASDVEPEGDGEGEGEEDAEEEAEPDVEAEPDALVETLGTGLVLGGGIRWSVSPWLPVGRPNHWPVAGSTSTITVTSTSEGTTTTVFPGSKDVHLVPVNLVEASSASGASRGFPQAQRTRGSPWASMSTAVPPCSTDWKLVAAPLLKPWLVTRVSRRSTTGVSVRR